MKDALGNELKTGDMVGIQLARPLIFGKVVEATDGGLIAGIDQQGGAQLRPGRIVVISQHVIEFDPRVPIDSLLALRDDNGRGETLHSKSPAPLTN